MGTIALSFNGRTFDSDSKYQGSNPCKAANRLKKMTNIVIDVEADGPAPGLYSMVSFGAVIIEPGLGRTFYGKCRPLPEADWISTSLGVSGHTREETLGFMDPADTMDSFDKWLQLNSYKTRPIFWSDNNSFDWQFINYYFWRFLGRNPFGWSSKNINNIVQGIYRDARSKEFKKIQRKYSITKHTHHPVDDAKRNAEAMLWLVNNGKLKI